MVTLTDQHEPPANVRETSRPPLWCEDGHPTVLASRDGIRTAHFGHGISDSQRGKADGEPPPYHDGRPPGFDANYENSTQGSPASNDAEGKANHSKKTEASLQLCTLLVESQILNILHYPGCTPIAPTRHRRSWCHQRPSFLDLKWSP